MPRDNSTKMSKKEQTKKFNKKAEMDRKKKNNQDSDSNNGDINDSGTENEEMDVHEFRKYIQKIFPSKHIDKKIKAGEKLKKFIKSSDDESDNEKETKKRTNKKNKKTIESESESEYEDNWETASESEEEIPKKYKNKSNKKNRNKDKLKEVSDDESISLGSNDSEYESDEDNTTIQNIDSKEKPGKLNIIFTIGGLNESHNSFEEDEDYDEEDYDEDYDDTEDEDESVSSDNNSSESEKEDEEDENEEKDENFQKNKKLSNKPKNNIETTNNIKGVNETPKKDKKLILKQLKELLEENPHDKSIEKCVEIYEDDFKKEQKRAEKKQKKQKDKNNRIFRKLLSDKNTMNDFSFYEKLELDNQKKLIKELREINKITRIEKPYRMTLLESNIPVEFKAAAMKKVNSLRYMEPGSGEFYKIKNWVDTFMKIPFTNYQALPISIEDGVDKCHEFMENAQKTLENAVYGLNDAKMQIMQMLGQLLTNPKAIGSAIAIHGPPGTGKTSIIKEGISKILNRPFAFIALGGATDSSFLEGHGYTYEGSTWGKIVQILIDSKCMNPVIYFDELDKISDTPRGEEITGILTHLTDTTQNSQFHDKYFAEINFDLSKCLFIFSYNDESKVNPILKDRMYRIKTKGYSGKEKTVIAKNYLMPKIREQVKFNDNEIIISDEVLSYINENHCNKEDGVRNMKRCLEIIHTKINLYRLMKPGTNLFEGEMSLKVEFPFVITKNIVDKLIKKESDGLETWRSLYV
jgi:ATP-dependent Lon protease